jgi:hypothetical protein
VIPVLWRDRLFLFWLRILQQKPSDPGQVAASTSSKDLAQTSLKEISDDARAKAQTSGKLAVQALLCWSEYYGGKWQPARTSDVNRPAMLGQFHAGEFDRSGLRLAAFDAENALGISISGQGGASFFLYNTHTLPLRDEDAFPLANIPVLGPSRYIDTMTQNLRIEYSTGLLEMGQGGSLSGKPLAREILYNDLRDRSVEPRHPLAEPWDVPFFYSDGVHVFFVTTTEAPVWIQDYWKYGAWLDSGLEQKVAIPPLVFQTSPELKAKRNLWIDGGPGGPSASVIDPAPISKFITEDAYIRQGLGTAATLNFDGLRIGPSGAIQGNGIKERKP